MSKDHFTKQGCRTLQVGFLEFDPLFFIFHQFIHSSCLLETSLHQNQSMWFHRVKAGLWCWNSLGEWTGVALVFGVKDAIAAGRGLLGPCSPHTSMREWVLVDCTGPASCFFRKQPWICSSLEKWAFNSRVSYHNTVLFKMKKKIFFPPGEFAYKWKCV